MAAQSYASYLCFLMVVCTHTLEKKLPLYVINTQKQYFEAVPYKEK